MGFRQWRQKHSMSDPVRGEFRRTSSYVPKSTVHGVLEMMTGVVTGPGVPPTPGEAMEDSGGRFVGRDTFPALIDRADPSHFRIEWDEVQPFDDRAAAREQAARAARDAATQAVAGSSGLSMDKTQTDAPPEWARGLVADLAGRGLIPGLDAGSLNATVDAPKVTIEVDGPAATGLPGTAVVREVTDVVLPPGSIPYPEGSMCDLTLDVSSSTGTYRAGTRQGFRSPATRAAIAVPGTVLPVRVDPANPLHVTIDVAQFCRQNPGLAV